MLAETRSGSAQIILATSQVLLAGGRAQSLSIEQTAWQRPSAQVDRALQSLLYAQSWALWG
jgi:hypothetical protein